MDEQASEDLMQPTIALWGIDQSCELSRHDDKDAEADDAEKDPQQDPPPFAVGEGTSNSVAGPGAADLDKALDRSISLGDFLQQLKTPRPLRFFSETHHGSWACSGDAESEQQSATVEMYDVELSKFKTKYAELRATLRIREDTV